MKTTANSISALLKTKHSKDFCVPECKTGASDRGLSIMDMWVMKKSWAHPLCTTYEIKVSRSDFLRDEKWRAYLPFCNQFYFICPHGLIDPKEISIEAGLMWVSKTGGRAYTKLKAPFREVQIPDSLWRYILMWRVSLDDRAGEESDADFWRRWLDQKEENRKLGYMVSRAVVKKVAEVEAENQRLKHENEEMRDVRDMLSGMGLVPTSWRLCHEVRRRLNGHAPIEWTRAVEDALNQLTKLKKQMVPVEKQ